MTRCGGRVQKDVGQQPQLALPDRGVDQKHESVDIHIGQNAIFGHRGGQALAKQTVQAVQFTGTPKHRTQPSLRGLQGLRR